MSNDELDRVGGVRVLLRSGVATSVREAAALSRTEFARRLGVDPATVWRWECGLRSPRTRVALQLADLYAELIGGSE